MRKVVKRGPKTENPSARIEWESVPTDMADLQWLDWGRHVIWTDRHGGRIPFERVALPWLRNIVSFLERVQERQVAEENAAWSYPGQGEMASYYADQSANQLSEENGNRGVFIEWLRSYLTFRERHESALGTYVEARRAWSRDIHIPDYVASHDAARDGSVPGWPRSALN